MTNDELRKFLEGVALARRGDGEVLIWDRHSQCNVRIEQVTYGADGTVYIQGEFLEWDDKTQKWR